jgi:hypothetical protein
MAHALSLTAIDDLSTITMPDDGDDLATADVEAIIQTLGNRAVMHRTALLGHIAWTERMSVAPGGSLTSFSIAIGGILRVVGDDSNGVRRATGAAATTITQTKIEGGGGTLGASARWWYVYAFLTIGGTVDYAISLTGPDAYGRTKDGDTTRVYLGCFPTDTTGAPYPLTRTGNRTLYRRSGVAAVTNLLASNGLRLINPSAAQTSFTAIDLRPVVPPHSRAALLRLTAIGDANPYTAELALYTGTDSTTASAAASAYTIDHHEVRADVEVEIAQAAQSVTYKLTQSGAGSINGYVDALGFLE